MLRTEQIERTFSVPGGCQLCVSNITGKIAVNGGESDQVHVVAIKRWRSQRQADATEIDIGQEGSRVWARSRLCRKQGWWGWARGGAASVDYVIELPRHSQVKASSVSGAAEVSSIEGQVSIESVSGPIVVRDAQGPLSVKTVSGDVSGQALRGRVHLETISGRVDLADSDLSSLSAASVSGPLRIATDLQPTGEYRAQTVSGNVELLVPTTLQCTVEGHSISGRLRTTLAQTSRGHGPGTWRIEVGGGGVGLHFDSVSGDLILRAAEGEAGAELTGAGSSEATTGAAPEAAPPTPVYSTAMDVLSAIEAGELSVEEGGTWLRQLKERQRT